MLAKSINVVIKNRSHYFISHGGIELNMGKGFQWPV